ncbi:MAG: hypothetical protein IJ728_09770 [Selenomonadaceae bacterium]|nr:hypothetical protein [Selenomonadaceae bacterium]
MQKFFGLIIIIMLMSSTCLAMNFQQSIKLGSFSTLPPYGAFRFEGATSNQGELSKEVEYKSGTEYAKGVAAFGTGENILYVHYDNSYFYTDDFKLNAFKSKELINSCRIGDSNIENTLILPLSFPHSCNIYQIKNDSNMSLYLLEYDTTGIPSYKVIGKRSDGKWLRYFETVAAEQYYGMFNAFCHSFKLDGDQIIFQYGRYDIVEKKFITNVELHFIWNYADQWFGVEQVNINVEQSKIDNSKGSEENFEEETDF